ncbi:hypothetical protein PG988_012835 [Apiospora saccharicola]
MPDDGDWIEPHIGETLWEWGDEELSIHHGERLDEKGKWTLAFEMWDKVITSDSTFMGFVETKLAKPCQVVLLSLLSWYRSEYDYPEVSNTAWEAVKSYKESPGMSYEEWKVNLAVNLTEQVRDVDEMDTSSLKSDYQVMHAVLWIEEMTLRLNPFESWGELQHFRRRALEAAVVQRFSWFVVKSRKAQYWEEYNQSLNTGLSEEDMASQDCVTAQARLDACPWINDPNPAGPHFLYDIDESKTIEVTDEIPPYAVISHTWGRWAIERKVQVQGVDWLVPQNQRFSVEWLPNALKEQRYAGRAFQNIRYVWIDLFCIPQDEGDYKREEEIAKLAQVFRGAVVGYVWMNNVSDWRGAAAALEEICLSAQERKDSVSFQFNSNAGNALWVAQKDSADMKGKMELFGEWLGPFDDPDMIDKNLPPGRQTQVPNGWFTSLWTLQKYGLRPDMQILNQNWEPFAICQAKAHRLRVTVGALGCLARIADEEALGFTSSTVRPDSCDRHQTAAQSLGIVLEHSRLGSLQTTQRSAFLCASRSRVVLSERYEAMMSITGATRWFRQCHKENGYDPVALGEELQQKVFGQWPITFLRDLRWQEGAAFFAVTDVEILRFWAISGDQHAVQSGQIDHAALTQEKLRELLPKGLTNTAVGTMLPIDSAL